MKLVLLLFDGFSHHLLCELAAQWQESEPVLDAANRKKLIRSINLLKLCGSEAVQVSSAVDETKSLAEILTDFNVGTNQAKKLNPSKRREEELGPLRNEKLQSVGARVRKIVDKLKSVAPLEVETPLGGHDERTVPNRQSFTKEMPSRRPWQ